jgi:hypothetical protein
MSRISEKHADITDGPSLTEDDAICFLKERQENQMMKAEDK